MHLRRAVQLVLVAWLCVCVVSIWAPMARAQISQQHVVHLCSGALAPLDAPNPLLDGERGLVFHHVLDCPLCLPVLAPPPLAVQVGAVVGVARPAISAAFSSHSPPSVVLPPVRAPPVRTLFEV